MLQVNLTVPFLVAKTLALQMRERGWAASSISVRCWGSVGLGERPAYTAAKGGLIQLDAHAGAGVGT